MIAGDAIESVRAVGNLANLRAADDVSHAEITKQFEAWDNVDVVHRDAKISIHGNSFSGIARLELLKILQRRAEQLGVEIGVDGVDFLDEPDGQVQASLELRERITRAVRAWQPEVVMTHDPTVLFVNNEWVNHPDHRAVGQSTVDAVFPTARDPLNFPEHLAAGLEAWKVAELYLWSTNEANQIVDIGETLERKVAALGHHASQFRAFDDIARWVRRRSEELGDRTGYRAAEGFRRVTLAR